MPGAAIRVLDTELAYPEVHPLRRQRYRHPSTTRELHGSLCRLFLGPAPQSAKAATSKKGVRFRFRNVGTRSQRPRRVEDAVQR